MSIFINTSHTQAVVSFYSKVYFYFLKAPEALVENFDQNYGCELKLLDNTINIRQLGNFDIYSQTTDIYSFGMVLYEMFSGKIPFQEMDDDQVKIEDLFIIAIDFSLMQSKSFRVSVCQK